MLPIALLKNQKALKTTITIIVVIVVLIIIYRWYKKYSANKEASKLTKSAENEIIKDAKTFTDSDYQAMADVIYEAMEGVGTDEQTIIKVIANLRTKSDWLSLVTKFGVKDKGVWPLNEPKNLLQWLNDEIGESERNIVNFSLNRFNVSI